MSIAAQLHLSGTLVETNMKRLMNRRMQTVVESGLQSLLQRHHSNARRTVDHLPSWVFQTGSPVCSRCAGERVGVWPDHLAFEVVHESPAQKICSRRQENFSPPHSYIRWRWLWAKSFGRWAKWRNGWGFPRIESHTPSLMGKLPTANTGSWAGELSANPRSNDWRNTFAHHLPSAPKNRGYRDSGPKIFEHQDRPKKKKGGPTSA
jgi:hypothetical protein